MDKKYLLKVYIAGIAPDTQTQIVNLKDQLVNSIGQNKFSMKVIDVLETPEIAEEEHILATPTIVRQNPEPVKKILLNFNVEDFSKNIKLIIED